MNSDGNDGPLSSKPPSIPPWINKGEGIIPSEHPLRSRFARSRHLALERRRRTYSPFALLKGVRGMEEFVAILY